MSIVKYLAIEGDDAVHERESAFWLSKGVSSIRVATMDDAIRQAMNEQFLYIGINADNINYKPKLKVLREITNDPIFIATTNYSTEEHIEASRLGADLYGKAGSTPEINYKAVTLKINQLNERTKQRKKYKKPLFHENVLVMQSSRQVFLNDTPIVLTKKEYEILCYFMNNRLLVLTFRQLYRNAWGEEYDITTHGMIRNHIKKINRKFNEALSDYNLIENERGVGYKLKQPITAK